MQTIYRLVLALHVIGGAVGLVSMLLPLVAKKGARLHRVTGWVFTGGMALSAVTGIAMATAWATAPATFLPLSTPLEARLDGLFLGLIGVLTGNALVQAIAAVRRKHAHARPGALVRWSLAVLLLTSLSSLVLGLLCDKTLPMIFGAGSLMLAFQDLRFTLRPLPTPMAWWYQHMNAMGTACISAVTAFLVLGARRWFSHEVLGGNAWLLWVAPAFVLVPLFQGWIAWYQRKFESRPRKPAPVQQARA